MFEPLLYHSITSGYRALGSENKFDREEDSFELLEECFFPFTEIISSFFPSKDDIAKKQSAPAVGNRSQRMAAEKQERKDRKKVKPKGKA